MLVSERIEYISNWIKSYIDNESSNISSLVVGISGGIDSAVTSVLCAKTNLKTLAVSMPIRQNKNQHSLSLEHINWLKSNFQNVESYVISLDEVFDSFKQSMHDFESELAFANLRSRLRMCTLYQIAQSKKDHGLLEIAKYKVLKEKRIENRNKIFNDININLKGEIEKNLLKDIKNFEYNEYEHYYNKFKKNKVDNNMTIFIMEDDILMNKYFMSLVLNIILKELINEHKLKFNEIKDDKETLSEDYDQLLEQLDELEKE